MYMLWENDQPTVINFMKGLSTGASLKETDPRLVLSNKLLGLRMNPDQKPSRELIVSLYVQAWNAYVTNKPRHKLNAKLPIPEVIGLSN
jgi:hypothetical protein